MRLQWQQLQRLHQQRFEAMVGSRGALQHCVRGFAMSRAVTGSKVLAVGPSRSFAPESRDYAVLRSKWTIFRSVRVWVGDFRSWSPSLNTCPIAIKCNSHPLEAMKVDVSASTLGRKPWSSTPTENFYPRHGSRVKGVQFSTLSVDEFNSSETSATETLVSTDTAVTGTNTGTTVVETKVSVDEFVPVTEAAPSTPLVAAIESQSQVVVAEPAPTKPKLTGSLDEFFASLPPPPNRTESLLAQNSDREIEPGRIYIGGLPFSVKGDELIAGLREMCSKYGKVNNVIVAQHRHQSQMSIDEGKHRGFAFVTMDSEKDAHEVVENMNGISAWGRVIMVSYGLRRVDPQAVDKNRLKGTPEQRCKLFVGNLHEGTTRTTLLSKFEEYGTVVDVKLITELHSSRSRGFGFVTFATEEQAMKAILDLDGSILDGSNIRVNIAKYPQSF